MNFSSSLPVGSSDPSVTKENTVVTIAGDLCVLQLRGSPLIPDIFQKWRFSSSLPLGGPLRLAACALTRAQRVVAVLYLPPAWSSA